MEKIIIVAIICCTIVMLAWIGKDRPRGKS